MKIGINKGAITSGENISCWINSVKPFEYRPLKNDISTDVLVIGGGIAGLSTAYNLLYAGFNVVLIEDGLIGSGESGRTTAHLTCALDDRYYKIEKTFGEESSRKAAESHSAAIDRIEKIIEKENKGSCHFERVNGYLFLHPTDKKENLEKEFLATRRAGLQTEWMDETHGVTALRSPCIRFPNQAQFHIMLYLKLLADSITQMGGEIYTRTHAEKINKKGAVCNGYKVSASHIVVATNTPVNDLVTMHTKQFPYRTYVIAAKIPKTQLSHALWWDTGNQHSKWATDPYHYIRLEKYNIEYDLLISGGEDHKTGQADDEGIPEEDRYDGLYEWTKKHFPAMGDVIYHWSGQVMEPVDYLAFIGKNPGNDNVYIITGDSGNGMTHTTIGAQIISDLIQGIDNPWADIYSPKRIPLKTPGVYFSEVLNMAKQYGDFIKKADITETDHLQKNEGAILGKGFRKIAVYRDDEGNLHSFSGVCPHLGCVVQWNDDEKTFDCPCHGSRFSKEGVVLNGPALSNLETIIIKD